MEDRKVLPAWARAPRISGRLYLNIDSPEGNHRICIDQKAGYIIGRSRKACDIFCDAKTCSRVHACLAHDKEGRLHLADLNSVHGTFVNGREMEPGTRTELHPGSRADIRIGSCDWRFSIEPHPAEGPYDEGSRGEDNRAKNAREQSHSRREASNRIEREAEGRSRSSSRRDHHESLRSREREGEPRLHHDRSRDRNGRCSHEDRRRRQERDGHRVTQTRAQSHFHDRAAPGSSMAHEPTGIGVGATAQKRKLLWGTQGGTEEAPKVFGANRWDAATFSNAADGQKFLKLMGVKRGGSQAGDPHLSHPVDGEREVLTADQQAKVLTEVESHFMQGLRRADGRKVGLGL